MAMDNYGHFPYGEGFSFMGNQFRIDLNEKDEPSFLSWFRDDKTSLLKTLSPPLFFVILTLKRY